MLQLWDSVDQLWDFEYLGTVVEIPEKYNTAYVNQIFEACDRNNQPQHS